MPPKMCADKLIAASTEALKADKHEELEKILDDILGAASEPLHIEFALNNGLQELCDACLSSGHIRVRRKAASIYLHCLLSLKENEVAARSFGLIKTLLRLIDRKILSVALRADLFRGTFDKLAEWCSCGKAHREAFLEVYPIDGLKDFDIFHFPSDILESYTKLIKSVIGQGRSRSQLLTPILDIFERTLRCDGNTCQITSHICEAVVDALEEFEREDPIEAILKTRLTDALVRHVVTSNSCDRTCLVRVMSFLIKCLSTSNKTCRRFIDQGVLNVLSVCFEENRSEVYALGSRALKNVFACTPEHITYALNANLVKPLFLLREDPSEHNRAEACEALKNFVARAGPAHLHSMIEKGCVPVIAKLLRSKSVDVNLDGLDTLFAIVSATRSSHPLELFSLHKLMMESGVQESCEVLKRHENAVVRSLALALHNFMASTFPHGEKHGVSEESLRNM